VSARVESDLGFRVPGKITQRLVDTGQSVHRGEALMRIDRTDLALATNAQTGIVEAARAKALQTDADEKRYRGLVSAGAVSASAYDQIKAAADAARAQLNAAQAQADVARNEASYSELDADTDGVVMDTLAEPGQVVGAGQVVLRLAHSGPREATVSLPETLRPAPGSKATATLFNNPDATGSARLRQLSDVADPQTRTYEARYVLQGAAAAAPLGATVSIGVDDARHGAGLEVPLSAIYDNGRGPGVWLIEGAAPHVTWEPVQLGDIGVEMASVVKGLHQGQRIVALGAHLLHEGETVRLTVEQGAAR
jgi:RND family efflux transporter MFP subunit